MNPASAIDRALRKTAGQAGKTYDQDARAIARVLVRHYGDEAEAVLKLILAAGMLEDERRVKR